MTHTILFFFFNDTATTEIYTLSLHDALPISPQSFSPSSELSTKSVDNPVENLLISPLITWCISTPIRSEGRHRGYPQDRKSTRLNSSHANISYAVFCLKKKKHSLLIIISRST